MFSLRTIAILATIALGCTSATVHPPARNGTWVTLTGTTYAPPSQGRRFKIYAPGPEDCWISNLPSLASASGDDGVLGIGDAVANIADNKIRDPYSIILAYHGRGSSPDRMTRVSRFHEFAQPPNERCSIVVYPQGLPSLLDGRRAWQPAPYANPAADDIQFTKDILKWLDIEYAEHASKRHVYASGKSNGAAMVAWIACRMSDVIVAFAPISAPLYLAADLTHPDPNCKPPRPVPIIEFHGTDDKLAPYCHYRSEWNGGNISTVMSWVQWWANKNGCKPSPKRSAPKSAVQVIGLLKTEIEVYHDCKEAVEVVHYRIIHGLHDWPSFVKMDDNEDDESNPSKWVPTVPGWGDWSPGTVEATDIIMKFFRRFQLP